MLLRVQNDKSQDDDSHTDPLKLKIAWVIFKNLVRTAKKTPHITITQINWLTLFKEIIAVYTENHMKQIQNAEWLIFNAGGTYIYHWALKGFL
jgi:hypothetical protein